MRITDLLDRNSISLNGSPKTNLINGFASFERRTISRRLASYFSSPLETVAAEIAEPTTEFVTDPAEKARALRLITERFAPEQVSMLDTRGDCAQRAVIVKIVPAEITGKEGLD